MNRGSLQSLSRFLIELSRRRVTRAVGIYIVFVWLMSQGVADLFPAFGLPDWAVRYFVIGAILAVPVVALVSWRFDLTPEGILRDPVDAAAGRRCALLAHWIGRDGQEQSVRFSGRVLVGRHFDADIRFQDKRVSREHARLIWRDGDWWVEDLGSSNGTFMNGTGVTEERIDRDCELRFHPEGPRVLVEVEALDDTAVSHRTERGGARRDDAKRKQAV
jgi:hypothetical protein